MSIPFIAIYNWITKHRLISLCFLVVIIAVCGYYSSKLRLSEDISKILPDTEEINNMSFVYSNSKFLDKVVFSISSNNDETTDIKLLAEFAKILTDSITSLYIPDYVKGIDFTPNEREMMEVYDIVHKHLPVFLCDEDYNKIDSIIDGDNIEKLIMSGYTNLLSPVSFVTKKIIASDPLYLSQLALDKYKNLNSDNNFQPYGKFFISQDKKNIVFLITPTSTNNTSDNNLLFSGIDRLVNNNTRGRFSEINVDYFGNALVATGNANQIKQDIILTISLALIVLVFIITFFFKSKRTFFVVFLPVAFGALVSLSILYVFKKEVSAISLGIGSVLLGISVDFALHIYSHIRQNNAPGLLFRNISAPVLLSSFTTASAFLSLYFINSEALNDLGLFAAVSIISAALFSLIALPHFAGLSTKQPDTQTKRKSNWIDKIASLNLSGNNYLKVSILIATVILFFASKNVGFDADMMKNNYMSDKLSIAEKKLNEITNLSKKTIFIVTPGDNVTDALENNNNTSSIIDSLTDLNIIQNASVINSIFPSQQMQMKAISKWEQYWKGKSEEVITLIDNAAVKTGFREGAFDGFKSWITKDFDIITPDEAGILKDYFLDNFIIETDTLSAIINVIKVDNSNYDINEVYDAFDKNDKAWVIDKRLITSEFVTILKNNFNKLVIISISLVFIILLIAYGRIELTIVTMIPMIFSWIWTVGIMGIADIDFNIFNVIILTFIFGLGIDYSIFIMRGLLMEYKYGTRDQSSYRVSVILSGITTLLGIGVLIFAEHPALRSIALMSIIGIISVIFITLTLLPAIFKWLVNYKKGKRTRPVTFVDFLFSMWALFVFIAGSVLLSALSVLLRLIPVPKKAKSTFIHKLFRYLTWFMIYMNFASKKIIVNPNGEDYGTPSIIIANHQSHIDLMLMMLLNYKVVVLTNPRNFNNPIYGPALRFAGFIKVDNNIESIVEQVKKQTDTGYSVVVFPEGHRSEGGKLKRFHKGAFYLANELNLDLLPIIIYGQKEALKKSEFFLKRAVTITKFLPRIKLSDGTFGDTPREQAKRVKAYFEEEYYKVARTLETPDYFNDFIKKNFLYKGPVLEWYTRIKLQLEDNYNIFNDLIPDNCKITDLGCGYGFLPLLLNLVSEERDITGIDYDPDKIAVATNCAVRSENVNFVVGDITNIDFKFSDVFVLNDVLHYMPKSIQIDIMEKCREKLNNNGLLIIRDADKDLNRRHMGTKLTEFFSTSMGFNKTKFKLEFISREVIEGFAGKYNLELTIIDNTKRTSNLIYIIRN